jgi:hypothetical protein
MVGVGVAVGVGLGGHEQIRVSHGISLRIEGGGVDVIPPRELAGH